MSDIQAILDKVRKLRQLANSSNVNEAANAAAAAEKLIQEHRIAEAQLEINETEENATQDFIANEGQSTVQWRWNLIYELCRAYQCKPWITHRRNEVTFRTTHHFGVAGAPNDLATVRYQYAYLSLEIIRLAKEHPIKLKGKAEFNSFYLGAVAGIREGMRTAREAVRETAMISNSAALVRIDAKLEKAKAAAPQHLRQTGYSGSVSNIDAFAAGKDAGRNVHQGARLGHSGSKLLK